MVIRMNLKWLWNGLIRATIFSDSILSEDIQSSSFVYITKSILKVYEIDVECVLSLKALLIAFLSTKIVPYKE